MTLKYVSEAPPTGYGNAGRGYLREMQRCGAGITWTPMVPGKAWNKYLEPFKGTSINDEFAELCNKCVEYETVMVHLVPQYYPQWRAAEPGKKLIGITVWETDRLLDGWLETLQLMDGLIVPCHWNESVFRTSGVTCPIHVAPYLPVNYEDTGSKQELIGVPNSHFVFYVIGNWADRKGMNLTLESFCRAFTSRDPVTLVIKTGYVNEMRKRPGFWWRHFGWRIETAARDIRRILRSHKSPPQVVAMTLPQTPSQMRALHARGDCYVSLTRSEGWGLGAYEAAFAGKPVIMTGHGGQMDFLPQALSYHVRFDLVPARPAGLLDSRYEGHSWAAPDIDHGAKLMREVFENQRAARERGRKLQEFVTARFIPQQIARGMLDFAAGL